MFVSDIVSGGERERSLSILKRKYTGYDPSAPWQVGIFFLQVVHFDAGEWLKAPDVFVFRGRKSTRDMKLYITLTPF